MLPVKAWVLFAALAIVSAVHLTVAPHEDECLYENVDTGNKLAGSFEVISGGLLDIDVAVYGPQGESHYSVNRQKQGAFTVMAQSSGLYRICFSNRMSTLTQKVVAFSLHKGDALFQDIAKKEHISPLETEITQLVDSIAAVEDEQRYMWARERKARDTNESTNSRVTWFSIAEALVLVALGAYQMFYLRNLFERKRSI